MKRQLIPGLILLCCSLAFARADEPLFIAPLYIEYVSSSAEQFATEVRELRQRIGEGPGVRVGFATFLNVEFTKPDLNRPIDSAALQRTLADIDSILARARSNRLPVHIS